MELKPHSQDEIYTVGHSNIDLGRFLNMLNGIEILVDARSEPYSKYVPQFNSDILKKQLEKAGIEYIFMKNDYIGNIIGGRPKDGDCYENGEVVYERIRKKKWYKEGISTLIELAHKKKIAIMCSEEDPYKCHRHNLIAQSLLRSGVIVYHIRSEGIKEKIEKPDKITTQLTLI
ncbi:MAG: DUF488 domain-containing protein [Methanosarcinales archaeon]|nr:MAG: DUF488 domain-containing protein [Methanosarcinales archaeon]